MNQQTQDENPQNISPCGHVLCCYNKYMEDRAYGNIVRAKIEPCRLAQLCKRKHRCRERNVRGRMQYFGRFV